MTCSRCHCHWCWLCCKPLDKIDPYKHFRLGECKERLFEEEEEIVFEEGEDEDEFVPEFEDFSFLTAKWIK